ncbi:transposase [Escherichia coli]|uniref:transposase n=1 Tax=Escherichia coli TaxID=562 RepID=UPI003CC7DC56
MTDAMRFPEEKNGDLYSHRWEIELGYREIKQTMQRSRLTLRSKSRSLWSKSCGVSYWLIIW